MGSLEHPWHEKAEQGLSFTYKPHESNTYLIGEVDSWDDTDLFGRVMTITPDSIAMGVSYGAFYNFE